MVDGAEQGRFPGAVDAHDEIDPALASCRPLGTVAEQQALLAEDQRHVLQGPAAGQMQVTQSHRFRSRTIDSDSRSISASRIRSFGSGASSSSVARPLSRGTR